MFDPFRQQIHNEAIFYQKVAKPKLQLAKAGHMSRLVDLLEAQQSFGAIMACE
jgi:hypothetical protein